jgi:dTDP-4-amino-4,6-dideoxygalactose transaminase
MRENRKYKIYLSPPHQCGNELEYLKQVLDSNWLAPGGECVTRLEEKLKSLLGRKNCVALNSGTAAIHMALKALGVGKGDFVICQALSFVAISNPIAYMGAIPVFVDSERDTWNMDPDLLEHAIIDLRKDGIEPRAIIYAHIYGNPAKAHDLLSVSRKYGIPIVEDAAEALGSKIDETYAGRFGDISVISFNGNKVITTSGGGALLTDDSEIASKVFHLSTQARGVEAPYSHSEIGYNYQMSNLSAALGLAQFDCLEAWVEKKRSIFSEYRSFLNQFGSYESVEESGDVISNRWLSVFLAPTVKERKRVVDALNRHDIECRRFWKPLHLLEIYDSQNSYISGVTIDLFNRGICLPSGVGLMPDEQEIIKGLIKLFD